MKNTIAAFLFALAGAVMVKNGSGVLEAAAFAALIPHAAMAAVVMLLTLLWRPVRSPHGGWGVRMLCLRPSYPREFVTYAPNADRPPWPLWRVVLLGWLTVRWADMRSWSRWAWTWRAREKARAERMRRAAELWAESEPTP